ncbi:uncharacterized protein LOC133887431 [Phragmites australis]|uniref:uncharacterized protein LOC133887431 n=1 Tax=Phragmites australis TaxID=29695 RepID=UPI002D77B0C7|nr:uncharacterized protein LOC133887431 [Phragmites australis]
MMWSSDSDRDEPVSTTTTTATSSSPFEPPMPPPPRRLRHRTRRRAHRRTKNSGTGEEEQEQPVEDEAEDVWRGLQREAAWPRRASRPVVVAGEEGSPDCGAAAIEGGGVGRARSLTDDDLEELKGCVDLGFGFSYHDIPELCGTLPALELCYSMSQRFLDEHQHTQKAEEAPAAAPVSPPQPVATNWKISSPGDSPDEVKARLKYWAQAVACTVRLCS